MEPLLFPTKTSSMAANARLPVGSNTSADAGLLLCRDSDAEPTDRRDVWFALRANCCNAGRTLQPPSRSEAAGARSEQQSAAAPLDLRSWACEGAIRRARKPVTIGGADVS